MLRAIGFALLLVLVAPGHAADCPLSAAQAQAASVEVVTAATPLPGAALVGTARPPTRSVLAVLPSPRAAHVAPASPLPLYLVNLRLLR